MIPLFCSRLIFYSWCHCWVRAVPSHPTAASPCLGISLPQLLKPQYQNQMCTMPSFSCFWTRLVAAWNLFIRMVSADQWEGRAQFRSSQMTCESVTSTAPGEAPALSRQTLLLGFFSNAFTETNKYYIVHLTLLLAKFCIHKSKFANHLFSFWKMNSNIAFHPFNILKQKKLLKPSIYVPTIRSS